MSVPSLKTSLERWSRFPRTIGSLEPRHIRRASVRVANRIEGTNPRRPEPYDLQYLYRRVSAIWKRYRSVYRVTPGDLRRVPWILFYGDKQNRSLGADRDFVAQYGQWLFRGTRSLSVRSLLHEFLRVYPTRLNTFHDIRQLLMQALEGSHPSPPSLRRWQERCREYGHLRADRGLSFVETLLSASEDPDSVVRRAGLDAGLESSGFLRSGVREFLPKAKFLLQQDGLGTRRLSRLLNFLELNGRPRFGEHTVRMEVANSLLGPFMNRAPASETKNRLRSFFLRNYRDPRLRSGAHRWSGISDDIRRVVIRWLVEQVLDQFLALVKETALDRHWRYREVFWKSFLNHNLIDDIWFALGSYAKLELLRVKNLRGNIETVADLRGASSTQSVLLLRMPGVTVAEWSHNGACRCWLDGNRSAPMLYKSAYHRLQITRGADFEQAHHGSPTGRWQSRLANWLQANTGIEVNREEYFPTRLREDRYARRQRW